MDHNESFEACIAPPGQGELSKLATTKSLERWTHMGFSVLDVMGVSQAGDRPSWPGGRTERLQATLRSLLLARRVVGQDNVWDRVPPLLARRSSPRPKKFCEASLALW